MLVFGNVTEADIIYKAELDLLAEKHPDRFSVHYILSNPSSEWKGLKGHVEKELLTKV